MENGDTINIALRAAHTTTSAALREYLLPRLAEDEAVLDFDVKIDMRSESTRSR